MPADDRRGRAPAPRRRLCRERSASGSSRRFARMRDFLRDEYLPSARASVGLSARARRRRSTTATWSSSHTTTDLAPDGDPPARTRRGGAHQPAHGGDAHSVGFQRQPGAVLRACAQRPRFRPASAQALGRRLRGRSASASTPQCRGLFSTLPKTPLEIRPTPRRARQRTDAGARYSGGPPTAGRPGVFYFNTYDLPRAQPDDMETLLPARGGARAPLQVSLAQRERALPKLLRFGGNTAYDEGWALYAESLGPELGLFTDPYQRFGALRRRDAGARCGWSSTPACMRTGWSRERAIDYMLANSAARPDRRDRRGRALHRHPGPGTGVQGRRSAMNERQAREATLLEAFESAGGQPELERRRPALGRPGRARGGRQRRAGRRLHRRAGASRDAPAAAERARDRALARAPAAASAPGSRRSSSSPPGSACSPIRSARRSASTCSRRRSGAWCSGTSPSTRCCSAAARGAGAPPAGGRAGCAARPQRCCSVGQRMVAPAAGSPARRLRNAWLGGGRRRPRPPRTGPAPTAPLARFAALWSARSAPGSRRCARRRCCMPARPRSRSG